jgi:hypothetical protein
MSLYGAIAEILNPHPQLGIPGSPDTKAFKVAPVRALIGRECDETRDLRIGRSKQCNALPGP